MTNYLLLKTKTTNTKVEMTSDSIFSVPVDEMILFCNSLESIWALFYFYKPSLSVDDCLSLAFATWVSELCLMTLGSLDSRYEPNSPIVDSRTFV